MTSSATISRYHEKSSGESANGKSVLDDGLVSITDVFAGCICGVNHRCFEEEK